jgi:phospholipase C
MMENHSFDNYFGMLGRGDGLTLGDTGTPLNTNPAADGTPVQVYHLPTTDQTSNHVNQDWVASHVQYDNGMMDGFVTTSGTQAMGYWNGTDLPFYYSLAGWFTLCDRYFSSVLAQTYPNRRFLQAATALGMISTEVPDVNEPPPANGTIFDKLDQFGISWHEYTAGPPEIALFPYELIPHLGNIFDISQFLADAASGDLPAFSLITPNPNVSEENPQDIHQGEAFSAGIVNALLTSPNWSSTVLVYTYDEHGGYYDHVPPPPAFPPDDIPPKLSETYGVQGGYNRLGMRVPAVVVSPYSRAGYVSHVVADHTSILRLIETKWNLGALTYRDANASNLLDALDLTAPPAFAVPPTLKSSAWPPSAIQTPPSQP